MNTTPNRFVAGLMAGVASALLVAAAPASALSPDNAPPAAEGAAAQTPAPTAKTSTKKYCVKDQLTGSRMYTTVCKTKAQWAAEGVDITAE